MLCSILQPFDWLYLNYLIIINLFSFTKIQQHQQQLNLTKFINICSTCTGVDPGFSEGGGGFRQTSAYIVV